MSGWPFDVDRDSNGTSFCLCTDELSCSSQCKHLLALQIRQIWCVQLCVSQVRYHAGHPRRTIFLCCFIRRRTVPH